MKTYQTKITNLANGKSMIEYCVFRTLKGAKERLEQINNVKGLQGTILVFEKGKKIKEIQ